MTQVLFSFKFCMILLNSLDKYESEAIMLIKLDSSKRVNPICLKLIELFQGILICSYESY